MCGVLPFSSVQVATTEYESNYANSGVNPVVEKPHARYVRVNLVTLAGGTSPTVTATVAVGKVV